MRRKERNGERIFWELTLDSGVGDRRHDLLEGLIDLGKKALFCGNVSIE